MPGIAQVWLTEDELDHIVKALVRYVPHSEEAYQRRLALLDKLRPLAYGTSCDVSAQGGAKVTAEEGRKAQRWCPNDYFRPVLGEDQSSQSDKT
jgi:hypothetical protein